MVPALGMSAISAGFSLLKALGHRSGKDADRTAGTGQNVPTGQNAPAGFDPGKAFDAMDKDGDGSITKAQFLQLVQAPKDGGAGLGALLALQEDKPADSPTTTTGVTGTDPANGAAGTNSVASQLMAKLDANGDGKVTKDELASVLSTLKPHGHRHHRHGADTTQTGLTGQTGVTDGQSGQNKALDNLFSALDRDGSGDISEQELSAGLDKARDERRMNFGVFMSAAARSYAQTATSTATSTTSSTTPVTSG